jgi:hypothetical protein
MIVDFAFGVCSGFLAVSGACTLEIATEVTKQSIEIGSEAAADRTCVHLAYEQLNQARPANGEAVAVVWRCDLHGK